MSAIKALKFRSFIVASVIFSTALAGTPVTGQMITQGQIDRKRERDKIKLLKLTAADFAQAVKVEDDDLSDIATFSTINGFRSLGGLFDIQRSDVFIRAHVAKATGDATFQVYFQVHYKETQFRDYSLVNFERPTGVGTAKLDRLTSHLGRCDQYSDVLGCERSEDSVFDVPEEVLRHVATRPLDKVWRMKFRATAGADWEEQIAPAEAAGLLAAIDTYKSARQID